MTVDDEAVTIAVRSLERDRAVDGTVSVKRFCQVGTHVVVAVEFVSRRSNSLNRGFVGLVFRDGLWRDSGGWSSAAVHDPAADRAWLSSGGWSNDDWTVHGGWVADASAALFRAVDPSGRVAKDTVTDAIAILIWDGDLDPDARAELLDADGEVLRSDLVLRRVTFTDVDPGQSE